MDPDTKWYDPHLLVFYGVAGGIAVGAGYILYQGVKELPGRYSALLNPADKPIQASRGRAASAIHVESSIDQKAGHIVVGATAESGEELGFADGFYGTSSSMQRLFPTMVIDPTPRRVSVLAETEVRKDHRGKDLGTMIYEAYEEACRELQIERIYLIAQDSSGFWSKQGFHQVPCADEDEDPCMVKEV